MDWLNIFIRIAVVIGGSVFIICSFFGAMTLIATVRSALELWHAKRRWIKFQRMSPEFQAFSRYQDTHNDDKNDTETNTKKQ
jgi:hypothetical protein